MAEAAGLVMGSIAMAALFTTCIDLFDRFELGRTYSYDYQLACTKMCLLKARLSSWGISLNLRIPGHEHPALRQHWMEERDVVGRSLSGIKQAFENASVLAEKYTLTPTSSRAFRTVVSHRPLELEYRSEGSKPPQDTINGWKYLRKRTAWALHDKQKLDSFIDSLSFLIDNLEKVTERIEMRSSYQSPAKSKLDDTPMAKDPTKLPTATEASSMNNQGSHGQKAVPPGVRASAPTHLKDQPLYIQQLVAQMSGNVYTANQQVTRSVGVMGNVGKTNTRHLYTGTQTVMLDGFGVMGDVSESAAAVIREPKMHRDRIPTLRGDSDETKTRHNAKWTSDSEA